LTKNSVQSAILIGIIIIFGIINLVCWYYNWPNWVFDDVKSRVNLLKLLRVGLNFFKKFLKMLWVNRVLKRLRKIEFHMARVQAHRGKNSTVGLHAG
jgi:hypothetical protein